MHIWPNAHAGRNPPQKIGSAYSPCLNVVYVMYPELWIILNKFGKYISYFGNLENTSRVFHNLDFLEKYLALNM